MIAKIKPYVFPANAIDSSLISRFRLGLMNYAQVNSWWAFPYIKSFISKQDFKFRFRLKDKSIFLDISANDFTHIWVANEVLVEKVYDLSLVPFKPDFIVDLGANIGLFSLLSNIHWPEAFIICVEPHPKTFNYLYKNLKQNSVPFSVLQCGVADKVQVASISNDGAVFEKIEQKNEFSRDDVKIFLTNINAVLPKNYNSNLLLKVDIEGMEQDALTSLSEDLPQNTFIFIELHNGESSISWANSWAKSHHFQFVMTRNRNMYIDGFFKR